METTLCKIREIYRSIVEYEAVFRRVHGLKLNEGMLLCTLSDGVRKTSGELSDLLGVTPSNMSKIISSTEKKGFVERHIDKGDKRQMFFLLTERGKGKLRSIKENPIAVPHLLQSIL